jgi:hypothetical protein
MAKLKLPAKIQRTVPPVDDVGPNVAPEVPCNAPFDLGQHNV